MSAPVSPSETVLSHTSSRQRICSSRLAKHHRILLVEEPVFAPDETQKPDAIVSEALPNLFVLTPRAAYIGVIDERLDYDLIAQMAEAYPEVQFLMCGPVVKVDPAHLPQSPNLHYPGQQAYSDLPRILKMCDICIMPFAQNDATRFISPTKTLEYMATHRPCQGQSKTFQIAEVKVSIPDVVRFYSDIVYLAETPDQFLKQVAAAFDEPSHERARRRQREEKIRAEQACDAIADNMETLMQKEWSQTPAGRKQRTQDLAAALPAASGKTFPARQSFERSSTYSNTAVGGIGGE